MPTAVSFRVLIFQPQYSTFVRFCQMATGTQEASPPGELARVSETEEGRSGRERWVKRNIPTAHSRNAPLPPPPTAAVPLPRGGRFGRSLGAAPQRRLPGVLSSSFYRSIYPVRGICFFFSGIRWHSVAFGGIRLHPLASACCALLSGGAEKSRGPEASAFGKYFLMPWACGRSSTT